MNIHSQSHLTMLFELLTSSTNDDRIKIQSMKAFGSQTIGFMLHLRIFHQFLMDEITRPIVIEIHFSQCQKFTIKTLFPRSVNFLKKLRDNLFFKHYFVICLQKNPILRNLMKIFQVSKHLKMHLKSHSTDQFRLQATISSPTPFQSPNTRR